MSFALNAYADVVVLIPSHSLEDLPSEVGDDEAAGLLNAFSVGWHPAVIAATRSIPIWHRADEPPEILPGRLILVPQLANSWLPAGWIERARKGGAVVLTELVDRAQLIAEILQPRNLPPRNTGITTESLNAWQDESGEDQPGSSVGSPTDSPGGVISSEARDEAGTPDDNWTSAGDGIAGGTFGSDDSNTDSFDRTESYDDSYNYGSNYGDEAYQSTYQSSPTRTPANSLPPQNVQSPDEDLVKDFLALGTCWLQMELLTRRMHHFSNLDDTHLQLESVAAADAAVTGDIDGATIHLRSCFEALMEGRERFYPVDCYLIDLCLLIPRLADNILAASIAERTPFSILISASDLETIQREKPELIDAIREGCDAGTLEIIGGEDRERPIPLMPVTSVLHEFSTGLDKYARMTGRTPRVWGRRRFGFSTLIPQILRRNGFRAALHCALDDGIYPDAEYSKLRWEGCDGTVIDAFTRIPLAADGAGSYLRFAQRMSESMEHDQAAAVIFARWPEVKSPWWDDFRRIGKYSPVLGRWTTFSDFFDLTDDPGRMARYEAGEYLTPFLIQAAARREADPVSRHVRHLARRQLFDAGRWYESLAAAMLKHPLDSATATELETAVESAGPDLPQAEESASSAEANHLAETEGLQGREIALEQQLSAYEAASARKLANIVLYGGASQPGYLVLNPLSFRRVTPVGLPDAEFPPALGGPVKAVQFDGSRKLCIVDLPGSGYAWIPAGTEETTQSRPSRRSNQPVLAEGTFLRNEWFEVEINENTGGISRLKGHGRKPNRLSQQLVFRFSRERTYWQGEGEDRRQITTQYSAMRCNSILVLSDGPACGEIVTEGDIVDPTNDQKLAGYRQTVRIWRGRPLLDVEITLSDVTMPEGDPWNNYFCSRFAWNDSAPVLTRSLQEGAHAVQGERIESPHYLEIASDDERTTLLFHGLPFHRRTAPRMLDSILIPEGETARTFRFSIVVDAGYPLHAALDVSVPPIVVPTESGPPRPGSTGWFFHVDAPNVLLLQLRSPRLGEETEHQQTYDDDATPAMNQPPAWQQYDRPAPPAPGEAVVVRLMETEGRPRLVRLRGFRNPTSARHCDFRGRTITDLPLEADAVPIQLSAYEIADIELRF